MRAPTRLLLSSLSLCLAWVWERPSAPRPPVRAGLSLTLLDVVGSYPTIWACGGYANASAIAQPGCSVLLPYGSWGHIDVAAALAGTARYAHSAVLLASADPGRPVLFLWGGLTAPNRTAVEAEPLLLQLLPQPQAPQLATAKYQEADDAGATRWGHSAVALTVGGAPAMLVYGGAGAYSVGEEVADVPAAAALALCALSAPGDDANHTYTLTWSAVASAGAGGLPPPRHYHAAALFPGTPGATPTAMVVAGGASFAAGVLQDVWQLDLASCVWGAGAQCSWRQRTATGLPPTYGHALLFTLRGTLLVYGGAGRGGGGGGGAPLLAAAGFSPASTAPLALAAPRAQGSPPGALLFGAAVVLDVDGDAEDEMVVVGGAEEPAAAAAAAGGAPLPAPQALVVLSDLDRDYAGLSAELPYLLAGVCVASALLVLMGYLAWRMLQAQRAAAAAGGVYRGAGSLLVGAGGGEEAEGFYDTSALLARAEAEEGEEGGGRGGRGGANYGGLGSSPEAGGAPGSRSAGAASASASAGRRFNRRLASARAEQLGASRQSAAASARSRASSRAADDLLLKLASSDGEATPETEGSNKLTF